MASIKPQEKTVNYRGADKSLARLGMKQTRKHFSDARDFNVCFFLCCC